MDLSVVGRNNQFYSEQEQDIIRRSRQACMEKFKVLRDEIRQLRLDRSLTSHNKACAKKMKVLQDEICWLKVRIRRLGIALHASLNKLPPEVLQIIFELCCEEPARISERRLYGGSGIYAISHVCSLWRQIALSTPQFWANVSIELKSSKCQLQIVEKWFSRAGNHPRSLTCVDTHHTKFCLSLPHTQVKPLKKLLEESFSDSLEMISIGCSQTLWERRWPNIFAPTTKLTKLIHLRMEEHIRWSVQSLMTVIPWNQLQYLDMRVLTSFSQCLDILSECASLIRCYMFVDDPDPPSAMSSARRPATLPVLRILSLSFTAPILEKVGSSHVQKTIQFLSVPRLSHLTLGQPIIPSWEPQVLSNSMAYLDNLGVPAICELLQRSNGMPDLVSLDLGFSSSPIDVRALLTIVPRLQSLRVRYGIFDAEVRNDIATGTLVPQLRSIKTEVRHEAIDVLRMVQLRHQNASMTPRQVTEFTSVSFYCELDSQKRSIFRKRLARLKKVAPRLSINLLFN